ncbi:MAG: GFA family protein [Roseobacter sp.]
MPSTKTAACFCGAVEITIKGAPVTQGYCHCTSCRKWTGQPVTAYALWPEAMVTVSKGQGLLGSAPRNDTLDMHFCSACGGSIMCHSKSAGLMDVYPMLIAGFDFEPGYHVNYAERAIDMRDGLPKFRDMPDRAGGSGEMMDE